MVGCHVSNYRDSRAFKAVYARCARVSQLQSSPERRAGLRADHKDRHGPFDTGIALGRIPLCGSITEVILLPAGLRRLTVRLREPVPRDGQYLMYVKDFAELSQ